MDRHLDLHALCARLVEESTHMRLLGGELARNVAVCDRKRGHYLALTVGYVGQTWVHSVFLHLAVEEGERIVIEQDGTNDGVTATLIEAGVREEQIAWRYELLGAAWLADLAAEAEAVSA